MVPIEDVVELFHLTNKPNVSNIMVPNPFCSSDGTVDQLKPKLPRMAIVKIFLVGNQVELRDMFPISVKVAHKIIQLRVVIYTENRELISD